MPFRNPPARECWRPLGKLRRSQDEGPVGQVSYDDFPPRCPADFSTAKGKKKSLFIARRPIAQVAAADRGSTAQSALNKGNLNKCHSWLSRTLTLTPPPLLSRTQSLPSGRLRASSAHLLPLSSCCLCSPAEKRSAKQASDWIRKPPLPAPDISPLQGPEGLDKQEGKKAGGSRRGSSFFAAAGAAGSELARCAGAGRRSRLPVGWAASSGREGKCPAAGGHTWLRFSSIL